MSRLSQALSPVPLKLRAPWLSDMTVTWLVTAFKFVFFILTYIILMNLLIAMMADTFSSVASNAEAEYQMQFARIVKEQVETTVLCVPLNVPGEWHSSSLRRIRGVKERLQSTSSTGSPETEDGAQIAADPATRCSGVRHSPPSVSYTHLTLPTKA